MIIIDGYNIIMAAPQVFSRMPDLAARREHLIRLLQSHPELGHKKIILVFDGGKTGSPRQTSTVMNITIIYSRPGEEADDVIKKMIRKTSPGKALTVVTSDRSIRNSAQDHGANTITAVQFWKLLKPPSRKKKKSEQPIPDRELSNRELKNWLEIFQKKDSGNNDD
jgi:predicted RNA-binding protein with PIN domain